MRPSEIIFMDQLLHHRSVASQIEETRKSWLKRSSWFPNAQQEQYSRISWVYADCYKKYGDVEFEYYAKRNRLRKEYTLNTGASVKKEAHKSETSMSHLKGYKPPSTTNGEYGSIRPSKMFFCFDRQFKL